MSNCLRLAVTPGEPAGIGPDLVIQLAQTSQSHELVIVADPDLIRDRANQLDLPVVIERFNPNEEPSPSPARSLKVLPVNLKSPVVTGQLDPSNAEYVLKTLTVATQGCIDGLFDALITAPVHKGVINESGIPFSGHTEFLEEMTGAKQVVMMLATEGLRVALATTHLPLSQVSSSITSTLLDDVFDILDDDLRSKFGLESPLTLVAGLNPHAGEGGHMGTEEIDTIIPAMQRAEQKGIRLEGPLPADTLFTEKYLNRCDSVLAMYHDQGLPVLKYKGFGNAVNITLGLPIIRTSVDHGTALDLAGTGTASASSLALAVKYASEMATNSKGS